MASPAAAAPPSSGDWVVTATEVYANQTIVIEGNVFVRAPGHLTLINVTLEINSTVATRRGIVVETGATLNTSDLDGLAGTAGDRTVIRPLSTSERIWFVADAGAVLRINQTAIWGVGYTQSPINASAVFIATNNTVLQNLTVYSSFFGILFSNVRGTFSDISAHNNTYNGIELTAASDITIRGLSANDNGGAGVHDAGGNFSAVGASLVNNSDGLAVKFGGNATLSLFDASGNDNGFVALNFAFLRISQGRITNNTLAGVDGRQLAVVITTDVLFSDNAAGIYGNQNSAFDITGGGFLRGIHAVQLRNGCTLTLTSLRVERTSGDALDLDASSADIFSAVFDSNAIGGTIRSTNYFAFLDSTLANSTGSGFLFDNATGALLHNPIFYNNRGLSVAFQGTSSALLYATGPAEINRSVVQVSSLSVQSSGTLRIVDATLQAVAATTWTVAGPLYISNASIIGNVAGATLSPQLGSSVFVRALTLNDASFRLNAPPSADIDGVIVAGSAMLRITGASYTLYNITQTGSGYISSEGSVQAYLTLVGGSAENLLASTSARLDLYDYFGDLGSATITGTAMIREFWSATIETRWGPTATAAGQSVTVFNATIQAIASGTTGGSGRLALGYVLATNGSASGLTSSNPHRVDAGSGGWAVSVFVNITSPGVFPVMLDDVAAPLVAIQLPVSGASVTGNPIFVTGAVTDGESGIATLEWSFDNATFNAGTAADPFSLSVPAAFETTYTVTVRATDLAGNTGFDTVTFRVDRTPPLISLTQPSNGTALRGPTVRFVGGTEVGATLTINGTVVPVDVQGDFDATITVGEGDIVVGLTAVDPAGNIYNLQVSMRIDSTPPVIAVTAPLFGSIVAGLTVDLVGFVEPGAGLSVDGVAQLVLSNGSFTVNVDLLAEGANALQVRSVDAAGNENTTTWLLVRDTRAPIVTVAGLTGPGPFALNATAPSFNITTDEVAFIQVSVSPGSAATSFTGQQLTFAPALGEGQFTLTVRAEDGVGNARTMNYSLRIDISAPAIILDARTEGGFVNASPWPVFLTAEAGAQVTIGGVAATPTSPGGATFSANITLSPGSNFVTVLVIDAGGNRATRVLNLTLDLLPPTVSITSPEADSGSSQSQITVTGTTEPGASVTVSGRDAAVDATGKFTAFVNLGFGANTITVVATDKAGNSATETRTVTRAEATRGLTGIPFIDNNLMGILVLIVIGIAAAMLAMRGGDKRRALADKKAALERDLEASRASRNDLNSIENFSSRTVDDPDFVSADAFRSNAGQAQPSNALAKKP